MLHIQFLLGALKEIWALHAELSRLLVQGCIISITDSLLWAALYAQHSL